MLHIIPQAQPMGPPLLAELCLPHTAVGALLRSEVAPGSRRGACTQPLCSLRSGRAHHKSASDTTGRQGIGASPLGPYSPATRSLQVKCCKISRRALPRRVCPVFAEEPRSKCHSGRNRWPSELCDCLAQVREGAGCYRQRSTWGCNCAVVPACSPTKAGHNCGHAWQQRPTDQDPSCSGARKVYGSSPKRAIAGSIKRIRAGS